MDDDRQLGFAEAFLDPRLGANAKLLRLDALIDWTRIEAMLDRRGEQGSGRRLYPRLAMLKAGYLQRLYGLSDLGLEDALLDRLSFRRFCGFALDAPTPDRTTIWRFRTGSGALLTEASDEINRQLAARRLTLRKGTLKDAALRAMPRPERKPGDGQT